MTVRSFVTSAAVLIFSWLAVTYFLSVPMESYPDSAPKVSTASDAEERVMAATSGDESADALSSETTRR